MPENAELLITSSIAPRIFASAMSLSQSFSLLLFILSTRRWTMAAPTVRPAIVKYLYTNNPFYAISAVLMLYAIRAAYEKLGSQASNCWLLTGGLAGYTLVLAAIGVWIVRWGKVWEDARSILLLLLVLFLAVSISADDLFVREETSSAATSLLLCGFLFSAAVSET